MIKALIGSYALGVSYPLHRIRRRMWRFKKRIRGKKIKATCLRKTAWKDIAPDTKVAIFAPKKVDGNVTLIELAMTSAFAGAAEPGTTLFEIGTFDGRTTLNLAGNAPNGCSVVTLDLPPDTQTKNQLTDGERIWVDKPTSGARFIGYGGEAATAGITQLYGDSADFDFSPFRNRCSLVFVDGSHSYENVLSDSRNAFEMVRTGGVVLWHDYGVWEDVTRALDEIARTYRLELQHIADTSLVYWQKA